MIATGKEGIALTPFEIFVGHNFPHPLGSATLESLHQALHYDASPKVIILTGPTGVGKTTTLRAAGKRILTNFRDKIEMESDFVPIVAVNAVPSTKKAFDWKDFYIRLLASQQEPLIESKLEVRGQLSLFEGSPGSNHLEGTAPNTLRREMEQYLRLRRTKYLFIDEAHHIFLGGDPQFLEIQFEILKSMTIETGVTLVLSGTYKLLDIMDQSGQLTRRSQIVHFPRYDMRIKEHRDDYWNVLHHVENRMQEIVPTAITGDARYFYQKSAGCVGILKDLANKCLNHALKEKISVIDRNFADRFAQPNNGLMTIITEACLGENRLANVTDDHLLDLLKNGILSDEPTISSRAKPRRAGQRNPRRDPVGGAHV